MARGVSFSHKTPDKNGAVPDLSMRGQSFRHSGNKKVYTVSGFAWSGNTDEWMILAQRDGSEVTVARTLKNHAGKRVDPKTGKHVPRYTAI